MEKEIRISAEMLTFEFEEDLNRKFGKLCFAYDAKTVHNLACVKKLYWFNNSFGLCHKFRFIY